MQLGTSYLLLSYLYISLPLLGTSASIPEITVATFNSAADSADGAVYKTVYVCAGGMQPTGYCIGPCSQCSGWLNSDKFQFKVPGTNCIDTDGSTSFYACNALGGPQDGYAPGACTLNTAFRPTLQSDGRYGYQAPGTNWLYLFSN